MHRANATRDSTPNVMKGAFYNRNLPSDGTFIGRAQIGYNLQYGRPADRVASDNSPAGRARNRRVELTIASSSE
jgi:hypothetical protein